METMKIRTNVTKEGRKQIAKALGESLGLEVRYLGVPSCAYSIGEMRLEKDGSVTVPDDEAEQVIRALEELGYEAEADSPSDEPGDTADGFVGEELMEPIKEQDADDGIGGDEGAEDGKDMPLAIEMPRSFYNDQTLENLQKLISSKAALIKKAVGAEELPVDITEEKVTFPWFRVSADGHSADETKAYSEFISRLSAMARDTKRVTAREREVGSEKYAFRCFLLRLGMSGSDFKTDRKILLRNLDGPSAFPNKAAADAFALKQKGKREAGKVEAGGAGTVETAGAVETVETDTAEEA